MTAAVLDAGWDGEWFVRAYDAFGNKVGSKECEEGKIFIEPQVFCVMSGIGVGDGKPVPPIWKKSVRFIGPSPMFILR